MVIMNVPEQHEKYIVARYNENDGFFWYWGSWPDMDRTVKAAIDVNGQFFNEDEVECIHGADWRKVEK